VIRLLLAFVALLPQNGAAAEFADDVRALLSAKCVDCHNPDSDSRKARREFDAMDDLAQVVDELVTPGDPSDSDLWLTVEEGEMPPDDSDVEPLTKAELGLLRGWIEAGAPTEGTSEPTAVAEENATERAADAQEEDQPAASASSDEHSFMDRLERFAARLHPLSTHFPVALLLAAALARLLGAGNLERPKLRAAEGYCLLLGTLGAGASIGLGLLAEIHGSPDPEVANIHRWLAFGTAGGGAVLVLLRPFAASTKVYGWLVLLTGLSVSVTGHYGGELAWGDDGPRMEILFPDLEPDDEPDESQDEE